MSAPPPLGSELDLHAFTNLGWDRHATEPQAVAAALTARASALPANADAGAAIGLAEHVWLSHLHDVPGLAAWLATLPSALGEQAECRAAIDKARWASSQALRPGASAPPEAEALSAAARGRALQNVWSYQAGMGHAADATSALRAECEATLADPDDARCRGLAATCNNLAVEGREGPRGDAARDAWMLAAAEASKALWARVGTWVHAERSQYQLARCHAVLGQATQALAHAHATLDALRAHAEAAEADDFEWFYGWEALAWAAAAAGDDSTVTEARAEMVSRLGKISDAELRSWCEQSLADFDKRPR